MGFLNVFLKGALYAAGAVGFKQKLALGSRSGFAQNKKHKGLRVEGGKSFPCLPVVEVGRRSFKANLIARRMSKKLGIGLRTMLLNIAFCVEPVDFGSPKKGFFFSARGCLRVRGEPKKEAAGAALWRTRDDQVR
jgi:hypothetical protein